MKLPNLKFKTENLKLKTILVLFFTFYVLGSTFAPLIAHAQEATRTVTIAYPTLVHKLNPGDSTEGITKVINQSTSILTFKLSVQDFIVTDTVGTPNILPPSTLGNKYSAAAWIGATPETFTLKPGESQKVNYYVQVPKDAKPGGHYAALVYTPVVSEGVKGSGSTVNSQMGSLFYITVNGPINEHVSITKFFANPFQEYGPVNILTQLKNLGDLHTAPKGTITVSGLFFNQTQDLPDRKSTRLNSSHANI